MNHLINLSFEKFNISVFKRSVTRYHMISRSKVTVRDKQTGKEDEFYPKRKIAPKNGRKRNLSNFQKKTNFLQLLRYCNMV